jgi:DNA polymerase I
MQTKRLFLIDAFGFIFRAYHARARSSAPAMRTAAGLATEAVYIFNNMLRKLAREHEPPYSAAVFESTEPTLRVQEYAAYKANRAETPPDLLEQIPYVERLLEALRIPVLKSAGYEADDVIGTLARRAEQAGFEVVVVSSDKDLMQLVSEHVLMLNPAKDGEWYDAAKVKEFLGVEPGQVADLLALKGDAVDNIPGAPGIGDKGARELIERFGSVEAAMERAGEVERKAYRESLQQNSERIRMSKRLATVETAVPIDVALEDLAAKTADTEALKSLYRELEFHSQLDELGPSEETRARDYAALGSEAEWQAWIASVPAGAPVALAIAPAPAGGLAEDVAGVAWQVGVARTVSVKGLAWMKAWLEDGGAAKAVSDAKATLRALEPMGIAARGIVHDPKLYAFLLDADPATCNLEEQARRRLDLKLGPEVAQRADVTLELAELLAPEVDARGLRKLYEEIELPLAAVLARMESNGIRIDGEELHRLSVFLTGELERLTSEIHALAGHGFNISSPQQLGRVLFEEMGLAAPARTGKTKALSTAADVLEQLAGEHEIARKVLEYRQLSKLKGTYVDALPALVDAGGRLHTSFQQTGAATGRLSSSDPNLQNIPIRTALGREIRAAFVPRPGWKLLAADYSQIELRLLAHMSGDALLVEAFREGEDIHTRTASEVLGVPPMLVTPEARRAAKAVNFGIVYGISGFGLAAQLGIPRAEAERYIRDYFARYAGVRTFLDATIAEVRQSGVTRTLFGRERAIPDISSRNANARSFAERTAMNSPLQGTAADLIKLAMVRVQAELDRGGYQSEMLLQVHDELIFECPPEEAGRLEEMVRREMVGAAELSVPLAVDIGVAENWRDAK